MFTSTSAIPKVDFGLHEVHISDSKTTHLFMITTICNLTASVAGILTENTYIIPKENVMGT